MRKRGVIGLMDELGWRIRLLQYGFEYMQSDVGEPNQERAMGDLSMLVLEIQQIIEDNGIEEDNPNHEGPVGPLPPYLSGQLE